AELRHRCRAGAGEVLDPVGHLPNRAGTDVAADVGVGVQLLAEVHEFVRAEGVVLHDVAPVRVDHSGTLRSGAHAVAPVVLVGEAAAGPPEVRDVDRLQRVHHVGADAPDV